MVNPDFPITHTSLLWFYCLLLLWALSKKNMVGAYILLGLIALDVVWNNVTGHKEMLLHTAQDMFLIAGITAFFLWSKDNLVKVLVLIAGTYSFYWVHNNMTPHSQQNSTHEVSMELLVQFVSKQELQTWISDHGSEYSITYPLFQPQDETFLLDEYILLECDLDNSESLMKALSLHHAIDHVEINDNIELPELSSVASSEYEINSRLNDPYINKQKQQGPYDLDKFHKLTDKHKIKSLSDPVVIAILDTGVDASHEDLKDNYISTSRRYDTDIKGHGTHCAGIAAAVTGNKIGIASLVPNGSPIKVTSVKVLNNYGMGTQKTIIDGIIKAADSGYDVISMSLGSVSSDAKQKAYNTAVAYAHSKGAIVVAAAGNSNRDARDYSPANSKGIIAVSAVDSLLRRASFANDVNGLEMGISAPGTQIFSTFPEDEYKAFNGTSMSAPLVSGLIGLMKSYKKDLKAKEAYTIIKKSALKKDGILILDPYKAMELFFSNHLES